MKNIRELTDEQAIEIGKLALEDLETQDWFYSALNRQRDIEYNYRVERELYDHDLNYMVVRIYIDGMPDCWATIWEEDFNVDVVEGGDDSQTANQV